MDKVEKIRNEIEKLHGNPYYMLAIKDVLSIIDSLQEENSFDSHIQEGDNVTVNEDGSRFNRSQLERVIARQKQPVSEGLELEEAAEQDVCEVVNTCSATGIPNDHIPSWVQDAMINEFIHGAKWYKEHLDMW